MKRLPDRYSGMAFALLTACGLGAITTQAKLFYADDGNALTLMLARFLVSSLVFGLLIVLGRRGFGVAREHRLAVLLLGLVWSGAMICYLLSVESISVSLASRLSRTPCSFAFSFSPSLVRSRLSRLRRSASVLISCLT